jgi:hypothetical protein
MELPAEGGIEPDVVEGDRILRLRTSDAQGDANDYLFHDAGLRVNKNSTYSLIFNSLATIFFSTFSTAAS